MHKRMYLRVSNVKGRISAHRRYSEMACALVLVCDVEDKESLQLWRRSHTTYATQDEHASDYLEQTEELYSSSNIMHELEPKIVIKHA